MKLLLWSDNGFDFYLYGPHKLLIIVHELKNKPWYNFMQFLLFQTTSSLDRENAITPTAPKNSQLVFIMGEKDHIYYWTLHTEMQMNTECKNIEELRHNLKVGYREQLEALILKTKNALA